MAASQLEFKDNELMHVTPMEPPPLQLEVYSLIEGVFAKAGGEDLPRTRALATKSLQLNGLLPPFLPRMATERSRQCPPSSEHFRRADL
jgi:hypothetical protein